MKMSVFMQQLNLPNDMLPEQYYSLARGARKTKAPYRVVEMTAEEFLDSRVSRCFVRNGRRLHVDTPYAKQTQPSLS